MTSFATTSCPRPWRPRRGVPRYPSAGPVAAPREAERPARAPRAKRALPSIPLPWLGVGVAVVVLLLVAGFLLRGKVFSGGGAVAEALIEAEQLARQGQLQEAVQLLQSLQGQAEGEQANQINQRVLEYQRRLKAKAAPQPVAASRIVADALAGGRRVKAMRLLREGLAKIPGDPELLKLQSEITSYSPTISALADAIGNRSWETIRNLAGQVLKEHPDDTEIQRIWSVATFNAAVLQLRKYQVAQGHDLLVQLAIDEPGPRDPAPERAREELSLAPCRPPLPDLRGKHRVADAGVMPPRTPPPGQLDIPLVWEHGQERPPADREDPARAPKRPTSFGATWRLWLSALADLGILMFFAAVGWGVAAAVGAELAAPQLLLAGLAGLEAASVVAVGCLWGWRATPGMLVVGICFARPIPGGECAGSGCAGCCRCWSPGFRCCVRRRGESVAESLADGALSFRSLPEGA